MYFGMDDGTWLFLEQLVTTADNGLTIIVSKTMQQKPTEPTIEKIKAVFGDSEDILRKFEGYMTLLPDSEQMYRIHFEHYLIYQCSDESYAAYDHDEIRIGQGLVLFEKSKLLEHMDKFIYTDLAQDLHGTTASGERRELRHYGVYTLDSIVDIITFFEPVIERVDRRK